MQSLNCLLYSEEGRRRKALPPSAYPSMTPREQAAGRESVPNPRHCMKILTGGRGGVVGSRAPVSGTPHFDVVQAPTM